MRVEPKFIQPRYLADPPQCCNSKLASPTLRLARAAEFFQAFYKVVRLRCIPPSRALAAPITWTLQNVIFSDGATAGGTFVYDTDVVDYTKQVVDWNIMISGRDTGTFPSIMLRAASATTRILPA